MSPWGHRSRRQFPRASPYCVSCDLFAGLFPDPSSRPWWPLSSWRVWTLGTPLSPAFHSTSWNDSSRRWTPPPGWCTLRGNSTTSRRSCASYTGWRRRSESTTSWLSLSTNASMDQPHRTSLTNSADRLTSKDVAVFAPRRHHRWLCAELGCQPSPTWLFRMLPLVSGTSCHSTSRLQNLCLSSAVASRLISLNAAFRDTLTVVVPGKWPCHSGHVNRFC